MRSSPAITVWVATTSRADYGIYRPLLEALAADRRFRLRLLVSGMHLSADFGLTVREIEQDGFEIAARVEMLLASDTPEAISKSTGVGMIGCAQALAQGRPDLLFVLGDRFEMHAIALAALPFKIPVAHVHGGELTAGATDDALRHSMTKLSHLHYVSTREHAARVSQLGEEPWRIQVSGALALDQVRRASLLSRSALEKRLGLALSPAPAIVTFHPATLEYERAGAQVAALLAALEAFDGPIVATLPNADPGGRVVVDELRAFVARRPGAVLVDSLGSRAYFSLMKIAALMVGNSSSGLIEAPSFGLPVVNVGTRQEGRLRGANVIDVACEQQVIQKAIQAALRPGFRRRAAAAANPYGDGQAAGRIVSHLLATRASGRDLVHKRFVDLARVAARRA